MRGPAAVDRQRGRHDGCDGNARSVASLSGRLFGEPGESPRYYFVHSYHLCCDSDTDVLAECDYGHAFCASAGRGNIVGTQFHPEKSHRYGLQLMRNFAALANCPAAY